MRVPSTYPYCRQSLGCDKQAESVDVQLKAAKDYYDRTPGLPPWAEHLAVMDMHSDSKANFMDRPAGRKLLIDAIKDDVLIFAHLDRLGRTLFDMVATIEHLKKKSGLKLHVLDALGQPLDLETPVGQIIVAALAFAATMDRRRIGEETKATLDYMRKQGKVITNLRVGLMNVCGYIAPHPEEERQLDEAILMRSLGWKLTNIHKEFMRRNYLIRGRQWKYKRLQESVLMHEAAKKAKKDEAKAS